MPPFCARRLGWFIVPLLLIAASDADAAPRKKKKQPLPDAVLAWNQVMLDANAIDSTLTNPDQGGPARTSWAFAIIAAAVYDAQNSISHSHEPYLTEIDGYDDASPHAAITSAAYSTMSALYPQQAARLDAEYAAWLERLEDESGVEAGIELGELIALAILTVRSNDGSDDNTPYVPGTDPGNHQVDPINPLQGFVGANWGSVDTFVLPDAESFKAPPPPSLNSLEYAMAWMEVYFYGMENQRDSHRSKKQLEIGVYWAYDGAPGLGKPPRMYNQIVRVIAEQKRNSMEQNARLFALVNLAMGDAGIVCWKGKFDYELWRPILGIRNADLDDNLLTFADPEWRPYGAPFTNGPPEAPNFTPPFPAYPSGHATLGAAAFWTVKEFYGTDNIRFKFVSDELNGRNLNQDGSRRKRVTRTFKTLSEAIEENAISRVYLGIHWRFDATAGVDCGKQIAEHIAANALQPRD